MRLEDWEFQNRRVSTEIKYEYKDGRSSYELHSTGRSLDIDELYLGLVNSPKCGHLLYSFIYTLSNAIRFLLVKGRVFH